VLHCDGNEWYGGFEAVLYTGSTLDCFIEGCQESGVCNFAGSSASTATFDLAKKLNDRGIGKLELLPQEKYADLKLHSQTFILSLPLNHKLQPQQHQKNPLIHQKESRIIHLRKKSLTSTQLPQVGTAKQYTNPLQVPRRIQIHAY
jgi:hypothetical protein